MHLNAIKAHSSTPKNQQLSSGIGNYRTSGGLQLVAPGSVHGQRFGNKLNNMT